MSSKICILACRHAHACTYTRAHPCEHANTNTYGHPYIGTDVQTDGRITSHVQTHHIAWDLILFCRGNKTMVLK